MALTDIECIFSCLSLGSIDPVPEGIIRLNFTFITETLDFRVLSVRCKTAEAIISWADTLAQLAGFSTDQLEGNWDLLKGSILYLRIRDFSVITAILSRDRKHILKIRPEIRY